MNCETAARQLSFLLYGELSFEEEEEVQQHLASCDGCRIRLANERRWHAQIDECELQPSRQLLDQCRRQLRLNLAVNGSRPSFAARLTSALLPLGSFSWQALGSLAAGVSLLVIGFAAGRYVDASGDRRGTPPVETALPLARTSTEPIASRVRYVEPDEGGSVRIVVEEVRQRTLRGGLDDLPIRNLLLTAATEAVDPGVRVETVDLLKARGESDEVRGALLDALQHDPNAGVRLKALEGLRQSVQSEDTRRALTSVLLKDENPGIRIKAIDLLTEKSEPELEGVLRQLLEREQNTYVRLKCRQALDEMSAASVERY